MKRPKIRVAPALLIVALMSFAFTGCSSVNESETPYSGIWAGPGIASREIVRETLPAYAPTGIKTAFWTDVQGHPLKALTIIDPIKAFLEKEGRGPNQPGYYFIVSINPTIAVIGLGASFDPKQKDEHSAKLRNNLAVESDGYLFEYGSAIPDRPQFLWFSPDLGSKPARIKVDRDRKEFRIEHPRVVITGLLEDGLWQIKRLK